LNKSIKRIEKKGLTNIGSVLVEIFTIAMSGYCFCSLATKLVEEHPNCRQVAQVKKKKIRYFLPDIPSASSSGLKGCPFFFFCQ